MQWPADYENVFASLENDESLPLPSIAPTTIIANLYRIAQDAGLNHTINDVTNFIQRSRCFVDFCLLMQLSADDINLVFKANNLHFFEMKVNLSVDALQQSILQSSHRTLEDFANSLQIHPSEIENFLAEKQLAAYWKLRFLSQPVGKFLLRLRSEFKSARPVSISRVAHELGTSEAELNTELSRIFNFSFDGLIHLIDRMPPEKFYALILDSNSPLSELTHAALFVLITKMTLACAPSSLFQGQFAAETNPLLLLNPHVVLPATQRLN